MEASGQTHNPALYPGRESVRYPLDSSLGGPQSRSGYFEEEKNFLHLPEYERQIVQYVAQLPYPLSH
jgi:hypothetical protein